MKEILLLVAQLPISLKIIISLVLILVILFFLILIWCQPIWHQSKANFIKEILLLVAQLPISLKIIISLVLILVVLFPLILIWHQPTSIQIVDFRASPNSVKRGGELTLDYIIKSDSSVDVWLGANLKISAGQIFYNVKEDKVVTVKLGQDTYTRFLTIDADISPGIYELVGEVWSGQKSMPERSTVLDRSNSKIKVIE